MSEWISVAERLQAIGEWVLVRNKLDETVERCQFTHSDRTGERYFAIGPSGQRFRGGFLLGGVTFWKPAHAPSPESHVSSEHHAPSPRNRQRNLSPESRASKREKMRDYWRKRKAEARPPGHEHHGTPAHDGGVTDTTTEHERTTDDDHSA